MLTHSSFEDAKIALLAFYMDGFLIVHYFVEAFYFETVSKVFILAVAAGFSVALLQEYRHWIASRKKQE